MFTEFKSHKEISAPLRRIILEETLKTRVSNVPLYVCNDILRRRFEEDQENESLKDYEVESVVSGKRSLSSFKDYGDALVELDRILDYGENRDPGVVIVLRQAKQVLRGYVKGQWIYPEAKDKVVIKKRVSNS